MKYNIIHFNNLLILSKIDNFKLYKYNYRKIYEMFYNKVIILKFT